VAVMYNPDTAPYAEYYLKSLKTAEAKLRVEAYPAAVRSDAQIDAVIAKLGAAPGGGLLAMTDSYMVVHRKRIIEQTAQHKVPAVYFSGYWAADGGLLAYGIEVTDLFDRAAGYADRILRGAKPAELPVEQPQKFELVINGKTAKALGLTIPQTLMISATRVIE
jgi:putative tryptophan/tyrosine transport system substrate-binding protein